MATVDAEEAAKARDWWTRYSRSREYYRTIAERICRERFGLNGVPFAFVNK